MRKRIIAPAQKDLSPAGQDWLNLEELAEVELTSEDPAYPIESAFRSSLASGWRAAEPGKQTIRLYFMQPQRLRRIQLNFLEPTAKRTQEYVLRWSQDSGQSFHEIVRQQWNFSPDDAASEMENHQVELSAVTAIELIITPDVSGGNAVASLAQWRLA